MALSTGEAEKSRGHGHSRGHGLGWLSPGAAPPTGPPDPLHSEKLRPLIRPLAILGAASRTPCNVNTVMAVA